MREQVIEISPTGGLAGLQTKGRGLDLRCFGEAEIRRVTDIEWDAGKQKWVIRLLQGDMSGRVVESSMFVGDGPFVHFPLAIFIACNAVGVGVRFPTGNICFSEYEDAVKFEVELIHWCMKTGCKYLVVD